MRKLAVIVVTALASTGATAVVAGLSVYGDVQAVKASLARIELRVDALAGQRVAQR